MVIKPLHKWITFRSWFSISITKLQCPVLCSNQLYLHYHYHLYFYPAFINNVTDCFHSHSHHHHCQHNHQNLFTFLPFKAFKVMIKSSASMFVRVKSTFAAKKEWKWSIIFGLLALQLCCNQNNYTSSTVL